MTLSQVSRKIPPREGARVHALRQLLRLLLPVIVSTNQRRVEGARVDPPNRFSESSKFSCPVDFREVGRVSALLRVPPDIIMNESSTDITAREGTNVSLLCKAKGYPTPNISWRREDNQPMPLATYHGKKTLKTTYEGNQLNITRVSRLHMGAYLCIASNGVPPSVSRRILLHVNFPPVMWIPNQLVGAPLGKDVTLDCHTEAYPMSINYWAKEGGEMIINDAKYDTSTKEKNYKVHMKLAIKTLEEQDFGTYKCFAENSLGSTEGSIKLYEIPPPTSEPTKDTAAIRRQSAEDYVVFPRHQSLGSVKNSDKEIEDDEEDSSRNPATDGKYRAEEAAAAHEDNAHTANRKRNHLGNEKTHEASTGAWRSSISTFPCTATFGLLFLLLLT